MTAINPNQKGSTSMLTVLFVIIILSLIGIATLNLSTKEQRDTLDEQLAVQAVAAAETGVSDAVDAIEAGTALNGTTCAPAAGYNNVLSPDGATEYSCQKIDLTPNSVEYELAENESSTFLLGETDPSTSNTLQLYWGYVGGNDLTQSNYNLRGNDTLVNRSTWIGDRSPALMRVELVTVGDDAGTPGRISPQDGEVESVAGYMLPSGAGTTSIAKNGLSDDSNLGPVEVRCNPNAAVGTYACRINITNLQQRLSGGNARRDVYVRVTSLYKNSSVRAEFNQGGTIRDIDATQALIDVTGRSQDVYKRIQVRYPLIGGKVPDYALLSAESICKDITLLASPVLIDQCEFGGLGSLLADDSTCTAVSVVPAIPAANINHVRYINFNISQMYWPRDGSTLPLAVPLVKGCRYNIEMITGDEHSTDSPTARAQTGEQLYIEFFDASGRLVARTQASNELPDSADTMTTTSSFVIPLHLENATRYRIAHVPYDPLDANGKPAWGCPGAGYTTTACAGSVGFFGATVRK